MSLIKEFDKVLGLDLGKAEPELRMSGEIKEMLIKREKLRKKN